MIYPNLPLNENLESIRKALAGTTPGKWKVMNDNIVVRLEYDGKDEGIGAILTGKKDATWIAASKDVVEYLLNLVELYKEAAIEEMINYYEKEDDKSLEEIRKVQPTVTIPRREHSRRLLEAVIQKRLEGEKP